MQALLPSAPPENWKYLRHISTVPPLLYNSINHEEERVRIHVGFVGTTTSTRKAKCAASAVTGCPPSPINTPPHPAMSVLSHPRFCRTFFTWAAMIMPPGLSFSGLSASHIFSILCLLVKICTKTLLPIIASKMTQIAVR